MAHVEKINSDEFKCFLIDGTVLILSKEGIDALLESLKN
jgi:hypothetical protein